VRIKESRHPLVLTVNRKAELVVQNAEAYQPLLELAERVKVIEGICRGLEDISVPVNICPIRVRHGYPGWRAIAARRQRGAPRMKPPGAYR
jgi:hypothetical protein